MAPDFVIDRFRSVVHKVLGARPAANLHLQDLWRLGGSTPITIGVLRAVAAGIRHLRFSRTVPL